MSTLHLFFCSFQGEGWHFLPSHLSKVGIHGNSIKVNLFGTSFQVIASQKKHEKNKEQLFIPVRGVLRANKTNYFHCILWPVIFFPSRELTYPLYQSSFEDEFPFLKWHANSKKHLDHIFGEGVFFFQTHQPRDVLKKVKRFFSPFGDFHRRPFLGSPEETSMCDEDGVIQKGCQRQADENCLQKTADEGLTA